MAKYYDIRDDLEKYPLAWLIIVYSKRGPGKTYSTLRMMVEDNESFIYMKRTIEDVKFLTSGTGKIGSKQNQYGFDLSPFKPLNRDFGWNIKAYSIEDGLGGFWRTKKDDEGNDYPVGLPIGYVLAASAAQKFKGFDLSECNYIIYDEFIPKPWERVNRKEGDQILDLYETVNRDRKKRGRPELKLIALANATSVSNPFFEIMDLTDIAVEMELHGLEYFYDEERGIVLHQIPGDFDVEEDQELSGIQKAMRDTQWGQMAYEGKFGYNDFTNISRSTLKGFSPVCSFRHKNRNFYIYRKDGNYIVCKSRHNQGRCYNLQRENEQKAFYYDFIVDLRSRCIEDKVKFDSYSAYDLVVNYKNFFKV